MERGSGRIKTEKVRDACVEGENVIEIRFVLTHLALRTRGK